MSGSRPLETLRGICVGNTGLCPSCLPKNAGDSRQIRQSLVYASAKWVLELSTDAQMKDPARISCPSLSLVRVVFPMLGVEVKSAGDVWDLKSCVVCFCQLPVCFHRSVCVTLRGVLSAANRQSSFWDTQPAQAPRQAYRNPV